MSGPLRLRSYPARARFPAPMSPKPRKRAQNPQPSLHVGYRCACRPHEILSFGLFDMDREIMCRGSFEVRTQLRDAGSARADATGRDRPMRTVALRVADDRCITRAGAQPHAALKI